MSSGSLPSTPNIFVRRIGSSSQIDNAWTIADDDDNGPFGSSSSLYPIASLASEGGDPFGTSDAPRAVGTMPIGGPPPQPTPAPGSSMVRAFFVVLAFVVVIFISSEVLTLKASHVSEASSFASYSAGSSALGALSVYSGGSVDGSSVLYLGEPDITSVQIDPLARSGMMQEVQMFIKVLACNRPKSLRRLLKALRNSEYEGDSVHLEIIIDRCEPLEQRMQCQALARDFEWPFGTKTLRFRSDQAGLKVMWFEAWYPPNNNSFAAILEDDIEVSDQWYYISKRVLQRYYIDERDEHIDAFCLHPSFVSDMHMMRSLFYKAKAVCSWGTVVMPHAWKSFMDWVEVRLDVKDPRGHRYLPLLPPLMNLTFATVKEVNTWMRWDRDVWSAWHYRWMYEYDMWAINYAIWKGDSTQALAVNHQETGTNVRLDKFGNPIGVQATYNVRLMHEPFEKYVDFDRLPPISELDCYDKQDHVVKGCKSRRDLQECWPALACIGKAPNALAPQ